MKRPMALYILLLLHLLLASAAAYGSILMILWPDGSGLSMQTDWLQGSPFTDFLFPGILLFFIGVLLPFVTVWGLWTKGSFRLANKLNLYGRHHWSWAYSLYTGFGIQVWIVVQQLMTDYFILQPIILVAGMLILIGSLWPSVIRYSEQNHS